jgi:hypothetical protein
MTHSGAFFRSLLPWIATLFVSASLGFAMNSAIAGGSGAGFQQPCVAVVGSPMSIGVDSWVVAESHRAACPR